MAMTTITNTVGNLASNFNEYSFETYNGVKKSCESISERLDYIHERFNEGGTHFTNLVGAMYTEPLKETYIKLLDVFRNLATTFAQFSKYVNLVKAANDNIYSMFTDRSNIKNVTFDSCEGILFNVGSFKVNLKSEVYKFQKASGEGYLLNVQASFDYIDEAWETIRDNLHNIMSTFQQSGNDVIYENLAAYSNQVSAMLNNIRTQINMIFKDIESEKTEFDTTVSSQASSLDVNTSGSEY